MTTVHEASFRIADAFPAESHIARYVVRLSMAMGDLRIAGAPFIDRSDTLADFERFYYIRLLFSHTRETVLLIDPPSGSVVPNLEDFLGFFDGRYPQLQASIRGAHSEVIQRLDAPLARRPAVTLRAELKRLRNQFFHYNWQSHDDVRLGDAMRAAGDTVSRHRGEPRHHRALYADEIAHHLMHPFDVPDDEFEGQLLELHNAVIALFRPISQFVMDAEVLYIGTRPSGVVTLHHSDGTTESL